MATPRVFVSSTCYDLRDIRQSLSQFIRSLGFEPVLSNEGDVFYSPTLHVAESCLMEVNHCQMLVLIIGGRYGTEYKDTNKSITNNEFIEAIKNKTCVFTLVLSEVYTSYYLYKSNAENEKLDRKAIQYPAADDYRIFEFIDEVQTQTRNNAIFPFRDFDDIQGYLRKQWAGMLYDFLRSKSEYDKVADTLDELKRLNQQIENMSGAILKRVVKPQELMATVRPLLQALIGSDLAQQQMSNIFEVEITPERILRCESISNLVGNKQLDEFKERILGYFDMKGSADDSKKALIKRSIDDYVASFNKMKSQIADYLSKFGYTVEEYLQEADSYLSRPAKISKVVDK